MKKLLLSLGVCFGIASASFSQTSLLLEDFEGGAGAFTLNTSTQGGQVGLAGDNAWRSEEHTSELQSHHEIVCRLLLEKTKKKKTTKQHPD